MIFSFFCPAIRIVNAKVSRRSAGAAQYRDETRTSRKKINKTSDLGPPHPMQILSLSLYVRGFRAHDTVHREEAPPRVPELSQQEREESVPSIII